MHETITITYVIDSYIKNLDVFNGRALLKDINKVLQMKYKASGDFTFNRRYLCTRYEDKIKQLARNKTLTDSEKLQELLLEVRKLRVKIPEEFDEIGWWDRKVAKKEATSVGTTSL